MNRQQLVEAVGHVLGDERLAEDALTAVVETIVATVVDCEQVAIEGFGVFRRVQRPAAREVPATYVPRFDPAGEFRT